MRRRWPWILFLSVSAVLAGGSSFLAEYDFPPDEDGRAAVPMLRKPPPQPVTPGPIPLQPIQLDEVTFRVSFRWLGAAPSPSELEAAVRAQAAAHLKGFAVERRPAPSLWRKVRRAPLVPAPGLEFTLVKLPPTPELSPYETATSDNVSVLTSGQKPSGEQSVFLAPDLFIIDFHLLGSEVRKRLRDIDAFVIAFAEQTGARIKSDERLRHATAEEVRGRRLQRWVNDVPFGPSYAALVEYTRGGVRTLALEDGSMLGLPALWLPIPEGSLPPRMRHLLIGAVVQRFVENAAPDEPGFINLDVRALRHPDMERWVTATLAPTASGKIRLSVAEANAIGGRILILRPTGAPVRALCEFSGCDLTASFGE